MKTFAQTTPGQRGRDDNFSLEWAGALACFIIAGITGTFFRLSAAGFSPLGALPLDHVRNAHSHLMLFSWASPPLMILMTQRLAASGAKNFRLGAFRRIICANMLAGIATFVPFLLYGYKSAQFGQARIPLTIILSTIGMFIWYAFAMVYWRARRHIQTDITWRLWDLAVIFLALSTLGAWARGVFMGMKVTNSALNLGSIQFFLITFSFGWLGLGLLGEFHRRLESRGQSSYAHAKSLSIATWLLAIGSPLVFLNAPMGEVSGGIKLLGNLSSLLLGAGLLVHVYYLWRAERGEWPALSVGLMGLVGVVMLGAGVPNLLEFGNSLGLRVLFVHLLLLGVVTIGLLESRALGLGGRLRYMMPAAIGILLLTMLPTTGLWPTAFYQPWAFYLVAAGSTAPWIAASLLLIARHRTGLAGKAAYA